MIKFLLFLSVLLNAESQRDFQTNTNTSPYCYNWLVEFKDSLQIDSSGQRGNRLMVTEHLTESGCFFTGESIFSIKYFYGEPDEVIIWNENWSTEERAITYKYKLLSHGRFDVISRGDKTLTINCSKDYKITSFRIHVVDE